MHVDDYLFQNSLRDESEAELASRKDKENFVDYEFKVYKGSFSSFISNLAFKLMCRRHRSWFCCTPEFGNTRGQSGV